MVRRVGARLEDGVGHHLGLHDRWHSSGPRQSRLRRAKTGSGHPIRCLFHGWAGRSGYDLVLFFRNMHPEGPVFMRTHTCNELNESNIGQTVTICGWVNAYRGHGTGLVFVDVRDKTGVTQVVFDSDGGNDALMEAGNRLRNEDCIKIVGTVRERASKNDRIATGSIEVLVSELEVLSKTKKLPFIPSTEKDLPNEEVRLRYRYIDLRRPTMQNILRTRHRV
ncbi:MAG TPA: hypothetical protein DF699_04510, partial [Phycisphaerales bacterium]|nr:hypothetical protein [Phycisphaerales bacterium]